jgi:hypothetical protein
MDPAQEVHRFSAWGSPESYDGPEGDAKRKEAVVCATLPTCGRDGALFFAERSAVKARLQPIVDGGASQGRANWVRIEAQNRKPRCQAGPS